MTRARKRPLSNKLAEDTYERRADQIAKIARQFQPRGDSTKLDGAVNILLNNSPVLKTNARAGNHHVSHFRWNVSTEVEHLAGHFNRLRHNQQNSPTFGQIANAYEGIGRSANQIAMFIESLPTFFHGDFGPKRDVDQFLAELRKIASIATKAAPQFKGKGKRLFVGSVISPANVNLASMCVDLFNDFGLADKIKASDAKTKKKSLLFCFVANVFEYATGEDAKAKGVNLPDALKLAVRHFKQETSRTSA